MCWKWQMVFSHCLFQLRKRRMAQIAPDQTTDPMRPSSDGQRRPAPPAGLQSGDSKDGHVEHVSMFGKAKNKAKQLRDKVKENYKAQYDHHDKEQEEEEPEEDEDQGPEKPDENVEDVTKGMAGLGGLGAANKDGKTNQESEKVKKSTLGDILDKNDDDMSTEEPMRASEGPDDELRHKDGMLIEANENPKEDLSSYKESGQGRGQRGDAFLATQNEETGTDVGTPSIPQRAAQTMAGATGGILGLGKGDKQEGGGGEEKNSSKFDLPPAPVGLKEVPKPLEEEFHTLLEKSKNPQSDVGEENELSFNEKPTEEEKSGAPIVTKKASGLIQGLRDSLTSERGKTDDIVPEEQSRENQDEEKQSEGQEKGGQSYAEKISAAKGLFSSKLGYGGKPTEEKAAVEESKGEDKLQGHETEEKPTEEDESGASVVSTKDSGLIQGLKNSLTSDKGSKDDIGVPEEQSRGNQGEGKQNDEEEKGGQKSGILSKFGYGGLPSEEKAAVEEPKGEEKADLEESKGEDKLQGPKAEEGTENKEPIKSTLVSKLSPGEDDKALSEVITGAFSNLFYKSSPKEEAPPPPSSVKDATPELPQSNNPPTTSSPKGIVGRVTGVMSSFIGKKPKEDTADNSPHTQEPTFGEQKEDLTGGSETRTGNQIEGGTK